MLHTMNIGNILNVQLNRRRKNTILSPTVPVQCLNGLRYDREQSWGIVFENVMFAGLERIILYTKKGEINITAGTILNFRLAESPKLFLLIAILFRLSWGTKLELIRFWWALLKCPFGPGMILPFLIWPTRAPIWRTTLCTALPPHLCPPHQITLVQQHLTLDLLTFWSPGNLLGPPQPAPRIKSKVLKP